MTFGNLYDWFMRGGFITAVLYALVLLVIGVYKSNRKADHDRMNGIDNKVDTHIKNDERTHTELRDQSRTDIAVVLDQIKGLRDDVRTLFTQRHR